MTTTPAPTQPAEVEQGASLWSDAVARLRKNVAAVTGLIVLLILVALVSTAPWIAPYSNDAQDLYMGPTPPSAQHWFGTDLLGRDMLTRVLYGGRLSMAVGLVATLVSLLIGVLWGTVAGFFGGRVDAMMMRIVDILYGLPIIILVILLMVVFGRNIILLFVALGAVEWLTMARIVRGQVLTLRKQEFVEALLAMGISRRRIILAHLVPNVLGPIIVYTTLTIPQVMLTEAFLSFLGLGVQPPDSSWGVLISDGVQAMEEYPWLFLFPGIALALTLFALNFLGDGLRDALDPKASKD